MKKFAYWIILSILLFSTKQVYAKDTVYSLNKYSEEEYNYIIKSYDDNSEDGYIVAGTYKEKEEETKQVILVKYSKSGNVVWQYNYEQDVDDSLYGLTYSYDEDGQIDGYLLVVEEEQDTAPVWIKISLTGKELEFVPMNLGTDVKIEKVLLIDNQDYILVGRKDNKSFLAKYNKLLEQSWVKEYEDNSSMIDITFKEEYGFFGIIKEEIEEETKYRLVKYDPEGNVQRTIKENFESIDTPRLESGNNTFILYGYTEEVKLSNNKHGSYYMNKYNYDGEEEWETIGNTPVNKEKRIEVQIIPTLEEKEEYYVLSTNAKDNSIEVVRIDEEGVVHNKIKKIKNNYYDINSFIMEGTNIYFVGQINCPEDDNCDYDKNALLLVSDEDKVIEVKDNDSRAILIVTAVFLVIVFLIYGRRKRRKLEPSKKKH